MDPHRYVLRRSNLILRIYRVLFVWLDTTLISLLVFCCFVRLRKAIQTGIFSYKSFKSDKDNITWYDNIKILSLYTIIFSSENIYGVTLSTSSAKRVKFKGVPEDPRVHAFAEKRSIIQILLEILVLSVGYSNEVTFEVRTSWSRRLQWGPHCRWETAIICMRASSGP